jgi:cation diffusion facilitator CzcD-associated flavoprotein CzcO
MRKILIIGGGYAGFYAAWKLERSCDGDRPKSPWSTHGRT